MEREAVGCSPAINDESICELVDRLVSNFSNPSARLVRQEMSQQIQSALQQLKKKDREVLELLYLEQLKPKEVAEVLGVSQPTIWTRHLRTIKRLTAELEKK